MRYLLEASVGPVQGFIAASRKTRDLYAGSWIVSELAKAGAASLAAVNAELVFPWSGGDLRPGSPFSVSNKILAIVDTEFPSDIAASMNVAVRRRARDLCSRLPAHPDRDNARLVEHVEEMVEFYSAWTPFPDEAGYQACYREVDALLNARKLTRTFPQHRGNPGIPKSSLDGMRESVLPADREEHPWIDEKEELDGTAFLKRFVLPKVKFDSVTEVARLPFGGDIREGDDLYYAILMADGDSMGEKIGGLGRLEQEQLSERLSGFSRAIRDKLDGLDCMPVFSGGDELIAMIPLHRLIEAARALTELFREMAGGNRGLTISAGIAIVHEKEPLDEAREIAQRARGLAKRHPGKGALCITEVPRSGTEVSVTGEWDSMLEQVEHVVAAYVDKTISFGFAHELWEVVARSPKSLKNVRKEMASALAGRKDSKGAAELIGAAKCSLKDLLKILFVARKPARASARWKERMEGRKA